MYSINWVNDQCGIVVENGSDDCEWVRLAGMAGKGGESEYDAPYLTYLCANFCCNVASKNRILILLVVCGVEKHALNLNH